jgi:predicted metal-dependent phosphoesterase TrpH
MAKADLHVHSRYSEHPSEWFLQRLGAAESYTEPEAIYQAAKARGMSYVTITDHNRIEGSVLLKERYPEDVFTGVETTAYFPEDGCKIHILLFGLTEAEFQEVQKLRRDIYELREFIVQNRLAHSVAHATFFVNKKLRLEHIEKLMLLFNVFEGTNGGRNRINNDTWSRVLESLTPDRISDLYRIYRIDPVGPDPWVKGLTGGSDDHAGIFIGQTYTAARARSGSEFLERLRAKRTYAEGRHNDFQSLALSFYKVGYEFSKSKSSALSRTFFHILSEALFEKKPASVKGWLRNRKIRAIRRKGAGTVAGQFAALLESLKGDSGRPVEEMFDVVYEKLSGITDEFFRALLVSMEKNVRRADLFSLVRDIASSLPGIFLSVPFYSTLQHMYQGRDLLESLKAKYLPPQTLRGKTVLWFTDAIHEPGGLAVTLRALARSAERQGLDVKFVSSFPPEEKTADLPSNIVNLPFIFEFGLSESGIKLRVPAMLEALKIIHRFEPDEIWLSTAGPLGLLGLLMAVIFQAKKVGLFHADLARDAAALVQDEDVTSLVEDYAAWFYGHMDEVVVRSVESARGLLDKGLPPARLRVADLGRGGWLAESGGPDGNAQADVSPPEGATWDSLLLRLLGGEAGPQRPAEPEAALGAEG